jgi:hypothetical protein
MALVKVSNIARGGGCPFEKGPLQHHLRPNARERRFVPEAPSIN